MEKKVNQKSTKELKKNAKKQKELIESLIQDVSVSAGLTLNIGNYESVRVDAGISVRKSEGISKEALYEYAWDVVMSEVKTKAKAVRQYIKKK